MKFQLPFNDEIFEVEMHTDKYNNNDRLYVGLMDYKEGCPFSDVSSNFPDADNIGEGEFVLKSWGGLEEVADFLLAEGIVEDTGKTAQSGYITGQRICKLGDNYKPI
jgi:hypothetical protein